MLMGSNSLHTSLEVCCSETALSTPTEGHEQCTTLEWSPQMLRLGACRDWKSSVRPSETLVFCVAEVWTASFDGSRDLNPLYMPLADRQRRMA